MVKTIKTYHQVLEFWFGTATENSEVMAEKSSLWWKKDSDLDAEIKRRFEPSLHSLINGGLEDWRTQAKSLLAMVILADQFPRNMYRDTADAFATDTLAQSLTIVGLEGKKDEQLRLVERVFFYMPLMHAEAMDLQNKAVSLFNELVEAAAREEKKSFQANLDFAIRHRDIVARFGRFPHRNQILGRQSTKDEIEFLKQPGSSF